MFSPENVERLLKNCRAMAVNPRAPSTSRDQDVHDARRDP
jgi:hypothetical protein